ncbi:MAG: rhomboid family intramembrane serine protease [Gemmatimonadaceae bacterium]|nr:rhomboid family intramembrane serine protease [Gemmatimonadaceae bacterium]
MFPIGDENPTEHRPGMTWALLGALAAVWLLFQGAGMNPARLIASVCNLGMVPGELTGRAPLGYAVPMGMGWACVVDDQAVNLLTPISSMFLHGSWGHLLGNALFLWVFGDNVEDVMGHGRFLAFYLACGLAAAATHVVLGPASAIPTVGASGAISGVMGGYLLLFPRARVRMFFPPIFVFHFPAWLVLLWWFGLQLLAGYSEFTMLQSQPGDRGGVAVWAHVGGFVAGVLLVRRFVNEERLARRQAATRAELMRRYV